jgi:hypothetical protein
MAEMYCEIISYIFMAVVYCEIISYIFMADIYREINIYFLWHICIVAERCCEIIGYILW